MHDYIRTPPYTPLMQRIAIHDFFTLTINALKGLAKRNNP